MPKILIDKIELESLRERLDYILDEGTIKSFSKSAEHDYGNFDEIDEKEKLVLDYLNKKPGITKEDVVRGLEVKYSRVTILNAIDRLLKNSLIIATHKSNKSRINCLYVNYESAVLSMHENLGVFRYSYSELIDASNPIILRLSENGKGRMKFKAVDLIYRIVDIYNFLCILYITSDIFLWKKRPLDNGTLHTKFGLFFETMKNIHSELLESLTTIGIDPEKGLEITCNILSTSRWGFSLIELFSMLKIFKKYGLSDQFEQVTDVLWALSYPILPSIDPAYKRANENGTLKDWRNLIRAKYSSLYQPTTNQWLAPKD